MVALGLTLVLVAAAPAPLQPVPPSDPGAIEARAAGVVAQVFRGAHLRPPVREPSLSIAARALAGRLLAGTLSTASLADAVPVAISTAGGWDPAPRTLVLGGTSADALMRALQGQAALLEDAPDVLGVGIAVRGTQHELVVLEAARRADLAAFPRAVPVGAQAVLTARLRAPLHAPELVVTGPDGRAATHANAAISGNALTATLRFDRSGTYAVEVVGHGKAGPQVAAIFRVASGTAPIAPVEASGQGGEPEPADPIQKIEAVLAHINRVRAAKHLPPLTHDHALDVLALEHSIDMARNHYFAHVSPRYGDLHARLDARYAYVRAGENLGEASGALAAERAIEGSPAHLENTLDPGFTRIGLALFPNPHPGGETTLLLTEIFATPPARLADPAGAIFDAVNRARTAHHLRPLGRDRTLDGVASRHLAQMISDGMPGGERDAQDAAIEVDPALDTVAVDLFVGSVPADALRSRNALARGFNRIGVAAAVVDSRRFGNGRLWICVLYGKVERGQ